MIESWSKFPHGGRLRRIGLFMSWFVGLLLVCCAVCWVQCPLLGYLLRSVSGSFVSLGVLSGEDRLWISDKARLCVAFALALT